MSSALAILHKLTSIDESLKRLIYLTELRTKAREPAAPRVDLDGRHGDPTIKAKDPRDWTGDVMYGKHFSECPPEYLDLLAERVDYFNSLPNVEAQKAKYNALDAARARGWAARLRQGWKPTETATPGFPSDDAMPDESDIAF